MDGEHLHESHSRAHLDGQTPVGEAKVGTDGWSVSAHRNGDKIKLNVFEWVGGKVARHLGRVIDAADATLEDALAMGRDFLRKGDVV